MKDFEEILKERGYKITHRRLAIIKAFTSNEKHLLTASEVYDAVSKQDKCMNFSTVYRNLEVLTEAGILKRINLENGINYYELDVHGHHHHLICLHCGEAKTLFRCPVEEIKQAIQREEGFTAIEHKLEIYGYCAKCKADQEKEK